MAGRCRTKRGGVQSIRYGPAGGERGFEITALVLRIDDRSVKFVLVFLYGQGVTGCVEGNFHNEGLVTPRGDYLCGLER